MTLIDDLTGGLRRAFGAKPADYSDSPQFRDGAFHNRLPASIMEPGEHGSVGRDWLRRRREGVPSGEIPVLRPTFAPASDELAATWLGHSTVLIELAGQRVITDPVLGHRVSPSTAVGPHRNHVAPVTLGELPPIDAVLISHDHYDHLDLDAVDILAARGTLFVVPLGVGEHLRIWGVPEAQIVELDWDQSHRVGALELTCTEARHFSGRLFSRNHTLWSSWVIARVDHGQQGPRVFFGGDTGYTDAFAEIGQRFGGFDLSILPIGAYDDRWRDIHMDPAEAVRAHRDLRAQVLLPVHWATFNLAFHRWDEPIEWLVDEAGRHDVRLSLPRVGERFEVSVDGYAAPSDLWWRALGHPHATQAQPRQAHATQAQSTDQSGQAPDLLRDPAEAGAQ